MIVNWSPTARALAAGIVVPRTLPDIVDFLEGRTFDRAGAAVPALQLIDKDDPYRGPFTTENCPDIREILRACVSRDSKRVVIVGPTQSFKTTILIGVEAYTIAVDHGPVGHVLPNETPLARAFSTKRFQPIVENTPWLRALKPDNPDLFKTLELGFNTCTVRFAGSNSPGNVASWPYRRVIGDETDKFPALIGNESGTRELLQQRVGQFTHYNIIDASTPTVPWGVIWQAALVGTCERFYVPCPHCTRPFTHRFTTDRTTLIWDENAKHANGTWDIARVMRSAHYRCPHCQREIWENHRRDMLHAAAAPGAAAHGYGWQPDAKDVADAARADYQLVADPQCRSFFRSCFNVLHPNRTYAAIARNFLLAGRDRSKLQNFWNSELGLVYESGQLAAPDWKVLADRAEVYPGDPTEAPFHHITEFLPLGVLVLTAGVDKQAEPPRFEYEIVGWGDDLESWGIEYGVIMVRNGDWATARLELDRRLDRVWQMRIPDSDLTCPLTVAAEAHDTGHLPEEVYNHVRARQQRGKRAFAVKGSSEGYGQPLVSRPQKSGVRKVELWMIGTTTAKAELYAFLRNTEPGTTGYLHFPKNPLRRYDQDWFQQIRAERCETRILGGRTQMRFIKPTGARNEALDIRVYARAAYHLLNPRMEKIKNKLSEQLPQPELPLTSAERAADERIADRDAARSNAEEAQGRYEQQALNSQPSTLNSESAEFDPETGKIAPAEKPAALAPEVPNSYALKTAKPKPINRRAHLPRRGSWATRW